MLKRHYVERAAYRGVALRCYEKGGIVLDSGSSTKSGEISHRSAPVDNAPCPNSRAMKQRPARALSHTAPASRVAHSAIFAEANSRLSPFSEAASLLNEFSAAKKGEANIVGGKAENFVAIGQHIIKNVSEREFNFYNRKESQLKAHPGFAPHIVCKAQGEGMRLLKMDNNFHNMSEPFVVDLKLGKAFAHPGYLQKTKPMSAEQLQEKIGERNQKNERNGANENFFSVANYSGRQVDRIKGDTHLDKREAEVFIKDLLSNDGLKAAFHQQIGTIIGAYDQVIEDGDILSGASVLVGHEKSDPSKVIVRMIDFGNYYSPDSLQFDTRQEAADQANKANKTGLQSLLDLSTDS